MTALVVYESMHGSTQAVAQAIAEGLTPAGRVYVYEVSALAKAPGGRTITTDLNLLVVGGPTHAFGLSRPNTRQDAAKAADKHLRQLGCRAIADPRTFGVISRTEGLAPGELETAHAWGTGLAGLVVRR